MANEKKAVCGGFLIGDGLQMDGKVLSATGGSGDGYSYYFVTGTLDYSTQLVTLSKTFQEMYADIIDNKKYPVIALGDGSYYSLYYLNYYDEWDMTFIYSDTQNPQNNKPYVKMGKITADSSNENYYELVEVNPNVGGKLVLSGSTWSCSVPYTTVFKHGVIGTDTILSYQLAGSSVTYYAHKIYLKGSGGAGSYILLGCSYPTDTGIHFDYFKLNQDNTVEYTSKDITI